jgi:uncharacterized membrane protein SpoIIM required for sporulation
MKQTLFEERHTARWEAFEHWLSEQERARPRKRKPPPGMVEADVPEGFGDAEFPERYRELCQNLALARDRQYSPELVERLNRLALRGHHHLYGARSRFGTRALEFIVAEYPRLVRAEWRLVVVASVLLFAPLVFMAVLISKYPDAIHYFLSPEQMADLRSMYADAEWIVHRKADNDLAAFGFYIWNNISIDFRTFASGIVFGLGTIAVLLYNGIFLGAVKGYLVSVGLGENLMQFVAGHSGPELIAAALSGAAGLKIGLAIISPGLRSRKRALVESASVAIRIIYGAATMTLLAAFIEAFWSSHRYISINGKYAVGIALWLAIIAYLAFAGRGRAPVQQLGNPTSGAPHAA